LQACPAVMVRAGAIYGTVRSKALIGMMAELPPAG
jgi:hypothetical protein